MSSPKDSEPLPENCKLQTATATGVSGKIKTQKWITFLRFPTDVNFITFGYLVGVEKMVTIV